ncbi:MAG: hypothetical protein ABIU05_23110 [Nitrospirales bacterium]
MNGVEHHNEPNHDGLGHQTFSQKGSAKYTACVVLMLTASWILIVLADAQVYEYVDPARQVGPANVPTSQPVAAIHRKGRYHCGVANLELEQAVIRVTSPPKTRAT